MGSRTEGTGLNGHLFLSCMRLTLYSRGGAKGAVEAEAAAAAAADDAAIFLAFRQDASHADSILYRVCQAGGERSIYAGFRSR